MKPGYSMHTKTASAVTTKERSSLSQNPFRGTFYSNSNKVSERREEDEESSQKTKDPPRINLKNKNILELCDDIDNIIEEEEEQPQPLLSDMGLKIVFVFICITNVLVNVDHGWIPACTVTIKRDLGLDNASLGLLGSVVYVGLLLGSFTSPPIFHMLSVKYIILICILFNAICLVGFTMFSNFYVLWAYRFGIGFFQVFLCIYFPVWVDLFGRDDQKTIWLTILQTSVPLGVVLGYGVTAVFDSEFHSWQLSYHLQAFIYLVLFLWFAFIPSRFIENDDQEEEDEGPLKDKNLSPIKNKNKLNNVEEDSDDNYLSSSEEDDGYACEMSSKGEQSSFALSKNGY